MINGKRLRELREEYGFSRRELAERLNIAESQVVRYELEKNDASSDVLARIATLFGVSTDYLVGLSDKRNPTSDNDLTPEEIAAILAWRRGDYREAIKVIVTDE
jgi:transcriptional regulator with XRE-family HTH domain